MARKKDTPQKAALREMMGNYLKENNVKVKDGTDVNWSYVKKKYKLNMPFLRLAYPAKASAFGRTLTTVLPEMSIGQLF